MMKGRKDDLQTNGQGKGTFRFRYMDSNRQFEVQADNVSGENLLEGFRHVANAITGRNIAAAPAPKLLKTAAASAAEVADRKEDQEEFEFEPAPVPAAPEVPADGTAQDTDEQETVVGEKKPRRAPRAPKFLNELNLTTAKVQLADFIKEKNPDSDLDKYAVIVVWYKQHFNTEEVSIDFTAYDVLGWKAQLPGPDPSQTLRNLKNKKNWLVVGSKNGFFKVNWNGEDAVNKMPAAKAAAKSA